MRIAVHLAAAGALAAGVTLAGAAVAGPASATPAGGGQARPVFVQTDGLTGNAVVAYHRAADGRLTQAGVYPTGGLGGALDGSVVDHQASQGSLAYDHGLLYALNAGSNTVTVFAVRGDRLVRTAVVDAGGVFPVSVTVRGDAVYVLDARGGRAVQGFRRVGAGLVRVPSWHRALGLDETATPEFTHTPGQVAFTPDGEHLVVTTKAASNAVLVYGVNRAGGLSAAPTVTTLPAAVPFGVAFGRDGSLAVAETGPNAVATFRVNRDGTLTQLVQQASGQAATCWIVAAGRFFYTGNAGSGTDSGFRAGTLTPLGATPTDAGTVDSAASADGRFLYTQTGKAGVVDEFRIDASGALTPIGSVTVPDGIGGEGIAAL